MTFAKQLAAAMASENCSFVSQQLTPVVWQLAFGLRCRDDDVEVLRIAVVEQHLVYVHFCLFLCVSNHNVYCATLRVDLVVLLAAVAGCYEFFHVCASTFV